MKNVKNINLDQIKIENIKNDIRNETKSTNQSIYKFPSNLDSEDKKQIRTKIRRKLKKYFYWHIVQSGSTKEPTELKKYILEFLQYYQDNWNVVDFKIENFSNSRNEKELKNHTELLNVVKKAIS